jgi:hypothetical protein
MTTIKLFATTIAVALIATGAAQARTDIEPPETVAVEAILMPRPLSQPIEQPYLFPRRLPSGRDPGRGLR